MKTAIMTALAGLAAAASAAPAFVAFGWEFSRKSVRDVAAIADSLDKTPLDGIGVYLNEPSEDGGVLSTHTIMREAWRRETLEPLVPVARELTAHRSMRESFLGAFRSPSGARIEWDDDEGWARVASNMAIAAWFAREGGFRGLWMDPEDYHGTGQFRRRPDDPPYDALCDAARRRGRIDHRGVEHLSRPVNDSKLASHAVTGVKPERHLVPERRLHQQGAKIQRKVADRALGGEIGERSAHLMLH